MENVLENLPLPNQACIYIYSKYFNLLNYVGAVLVVLNYQTVINCIVADDGVPPMQRTNIILVCKLVTYQK